MKKYCSWSKLSHFQILKIYTVTLRARTLIAISRKSTLKSISSYSFYGRPLKHGSHVLGTKAKFLINQIFDLSLRKENIGFWNCRWLK